MGEKTAQAAQILSYRHRDGGEILAPGANTKKSDYDFFLRNNTI